MTVPSDSGQAGAIFEVSDAMRKAGAQALYDRLPDVVFAVGDDEQLAETIFRDMVTVGLAQSEWHLLRRRHEVHHRG